MYLDVVKEDMREVGVREDKRLTVHSVWRNGKNKNYKSLCQLILTVFNRRLLFVAFGGCIMFVFTLMVLFPG